MKARTDIARSLRHATSWVAERGLALVGASGMTLSCFMVLPLIQAITEGDTRDLILQSVDTVALPPPPAPPQEEPEPEQEEEERPPELAEESAPLDLSDLEVALEPGLGSGMGGGELAMKIGRLGVDNSDVDQLFSMADLDQKPRVVYQPGPQLSATVRKAGGGTVYVLFIVNQRGRVQDPIVQQSPDPVLNRPALDAVKKWRFEPGKRKGESVRFRMRVPITFPKG